MVDFSHFRDWVASQPSRKQYEYGNTGDTDGMKCALGQYLEAMNPGSRILVLIGSASVDYNTVYEIPHEVEEALAGSSYGRGDRETFGALAKRLAKLDLAA